MSIETSEKNISTDILVIGGGMAGMFAAIKAKDLGVDVTIADKGYVGKAGSTHFAEGDIVYFRPKRGHNLKQWVDLISRKCEYINNREWDEICLREAEDRYNDLVSWGIQFYEKDGELYMWRGIGVGPSTPYEDITMQARKYAPNLRKKVLESGVKIFDKIMFCELLKQDGQIVGAIGLHTTSGNLYVFQAKAVIIAAGSSTLKSDTLPVNFWTGDGEAMAYRVGAEISGKEFTYGLSYLRDDYKRQEKCNKGEGISGEIIDSSYRSPYALGGGFTGWYNRPTLNAEARPVLFPFWEAHCGRAPLYLDMDSYNSSQLKWLREYFERIELGWAQADKIDLDVFRGGKIKWPPARVSSMSVIAGAGIWPFDTGCSAGIPGLYAAGNSCATMGSGAMYAGMGFGLNHAMVTGTRAGQAAAEYAVKSGEMSIDKAELERMKAFVCAPMERKGGFSPDWVTQIIQSVTIPYFYLGIKHEQRLKAALSIAEFISSHLVPKIIAKDAHEWRLAQETRNMALNAEMRLRASLFRNESRGHHFREDYPRRDDPDWLAWVKIKEEDGAMKLYKEPVPKKWWPDLSKSYEERYENILPLEV